MHITRRSLFSLMAASVAMGATGVVGAAQAASKTIVFIPKSTDVTYWLFLRKGAADKAKELGYTVQYQGVSTEADVTGEVNLLRNVISSKPAGILCAATDAQALVPPVEEGIKAGVPILHRSISSARDARVATHTRCRALAARSTTAAGQPLSRPCSIMARQMSRAPPTPM